MSATNVEEIKRNFGAVKKKRHSWKTCCCCMARPATGCYWPYIQHEELWMAAMLFYYNTHWTSYCGFCVNRALRYYIYTSRDLSGAHLMPNTAAAQTRANKIDSLLTLEEMTSVPQTHTRLRNKGLKALSVTNERETDFLLWKFWVFYCRKCFKRIKACYNFR